MMLKMDVFHVDNSFTHNGYKYGAAVKSYVSCCQIICNEYIVAFALSASCATGFFGNNYKKRMW